MICNWPEFVNILTDFRYIVFCNRKFFSFLLFGSDVSAYNALHYIPIPLDSHFTFLILVGLVCFHTSYPTTKILWCGYDVERWRNSWTCLKIWHPQLGTGKLPFGIRLLGNELRGKCKDYSWAHNNLLVYYVKIVLLGRNWTSWQWACWVER